MTVGSRTDDRDETLCVKVVTGVDHDTRGRDPTGHGLIQPLPGNGVSHVFRGEELETHEASPRRASAADAMSRSSKSLRSVPMIW